MHEMSLCEAIVAATLRESGGRPVTAVRVRVRGHPVDQEVVQQGFSLAAARTGAARARVQLSVEPPIARCRGCGSSTPAVDALRLVACPACGGVDVEVMEDDDGIIVESITFAEPGGMGERTG